MYSHLIKPLKRYNKIPLLTKSIIKAYCSWSVGTLIKLPFRSSLVEFNKSKGFYKRTSFRTVSESYLTLFAHTLDSLWNVVKSVSVWFPQSAWQFLFQTCRVQSSCPLLSVHVCEDVCVASVRHVAGKQGFWTLSGTKDSLHRGSRETFKLRPTIIIQNCSRS